jgi:hypothetical protein
MQPNAITKKPVAPPNVPRDVVAESEADNYPMPKPEGHRDESETSLREVVQSVLSEELRKLVRAECQAVIQTSGVELRAQVIESLRPVLRQEVFNGISTHLPVPQAIEVRFPRKKTRTIKPPFHSSLPLIINLAKARANGFPIPLWIHGPKGVGKSEIARQVAEAFGVPFHLIALSPTTTEAKLIGFRNAATGDFVTGLLAEAYAHGGLALLDEMDIADPGVLVGLNSLISGRNYRFPNGKVVKRHPNFFVIAGANTTGSGAAEGYYRRKMDAAVLDRFIKVHVPLDTKLEAAICGDKRWAKYIQKVRAALNKLAVLNFELSPRSTLHGAALLKAGLRPRQVIEILLADAGEKIAGVIVKEVGVFKFKK